MKKATERDGASVFTFATTPGTTVLEHLVGIKGPEGHPFYIVVGDKAFLQTRRAHLEEDVKTNVDLVRGLTLQGAKLVVIDHHICNKGLFEAIKDMEGVTVVFDPSKAHSGVTLACNFFGVEVTPFYKVIKANDTYTFDDEVVTFVRGKTLQFLLKAAEDGVMHEGVNWNMASLIGCGVDCKDLDPGLRMEKMTVFLDSHVVWFKARASEKLGGLKVYPATWTWRVDPDEGPKKVRVFVSQVEDYSLVGLLLKCLEAKAAEEGVTHCFFFSLLGDTIKVSIRRFSPEFIPCNTIARANGGDGHIPAAGFVTSSTPKMDVFMQNLGEEFVPRFE